MNRESLNILLKKAYCQQLSEEERKTLKLWLGESRENILRRASHIQDVRQNTESGMSLDELSQNPVLDDTIRSYYNNPVQVAQVGSYYVFQSDGRHRTLAAQSLDTYIPVLVTGSYTRND